MELLPAIPLALETWQMLIIVPAVLAIAVLFVVRMKQKKTSGGGRATR